MALTLPKFWKRGSLGTLNLAGVFPQPRGPGTGVWPVLGPKPPAQPSIQPACVRVRERGDPPLSLYTGVIFNPAFQNITELPLSDSQEALLGRVSC